MNRLKIRATSCFLILAAAAANAQDPFDPFGQTTPAQPQQTLAPPTQEDTGLAPGENNPMVLAIFESKPSTPDEMMAAVSALLDIGRTDEAKFFIKKILAAKPNRQTLVELKNKYGADRFFRMRRDHRLAPEGEQLGKAVLDAAYAQSRDPKHFKSLLDQLQSASLSARLAAIDELRGIGTAALGPMLAELSNELVSDRHPRIREALVAMGPTIVQPLAAVLQSSNDQLRVQVIQVLGNFRTPAAVRALVGPFASPDSSDQVRRAAAAALERAVGTLPTQYDVEQYLKRQSELFYNGKAFPGRVDHEGMIEIWMWDEDRQTITSSRVPAEDAAMMEAARLASTLVEVAPENPEYQRLMLGARLRFDQAFHGVDSPLPRGEGSAFAAAAEAGPEAVEDLLVHSIQQEHLLAAAAACEVLGAVGTEDLLQSSNGKPRPLAGALRHGDPRLRMAAADAIMSIDPQQTYPGASFLPEALAHAIRTIGARVAIVGHPRIESSRTMVGMLNQLGFEAVTATTGKDLFRLAAKNPDCEFVLVSDAIYDPAAGETIQMLRGDPLTNRLPVGLMFREENTKSANETADLDPLTIAFPRPYDVRSMAFQVARLQNLVGREQVGFDARIDNALRALDHLHQLAQSPDKYSYYDLFRAQPAWLSALYTPPLSEKAAAVLGALGSPEAQSALVTAASRNDWPLPQRQAAAAAFDTAVQKRGLLLTRDQILTQYDRYNQSATMDAGTQQVLGSLLDSIEAPSRKQAAAGQ